MGAPLIIYKITPRVAWAEAEAIGKFTGAPVDIADGYIHFSTADQVVETASKHFFEQKDLLLVAIETALLGEKLKWEKSRGGDLFPHLYCDLEFNNVLWAKPMPVGKDGKHIMPEFVT